MDVNSIPNIRTRRLPQSERSIFLKPLDPSSEACSCPFFWFNISILSRLFFDLFVEFPHTHIPPLVEAKFPGESLSKGSHDTIDSSCLLFAYALLPRTSNAIHQSSIRSQWKNLNVIHNENSIYGNITVTKRGEQYTFYSDGIPSITTPIPDIASIEDFVHFPMLFHEKPESVLILSGGAGGMIHEILKYPVKRIDYVELDPLLLKLVQKFSTPLTQSELSNNK